MVELIGVIIKVTIIKVTIKVNIKVIIIVANHSNPSYFFIVVTHSLINLIPSISTIIPPFPFEFWITSFRFCLIPPIFVYFFSPPHA